MTDETDGIVLEEITRVEPLGATGVQLSRELEDERKGHHIMHFGNLALEDVNVLRHCSSGKLVFIPDAPEPEPEDIDRRLAELCGFGVAESKGAAWRIGGTAICPEHGQWYLWEAKCCASHDAWSPTTNWNQFHKYVEDAMWRRDVYLDVMAVWVRPKLPKLDSELDKLHQHNDRCRDIRWRLAWLKRLDHGWRRLSAEVVDLADRLPAACRLALAAVEKLDKEEQETQNG